MTRTSFIVSATCSSAVSCSSVERWIFCPWKWVFSSWGKSDLFLQRWAKTSLWWVVGNQHMSRRPVVRPTTVYWWVWLQCHAIVHAAQTWPHSWGNECHFVFFCNSLIPSLCLLKKGELGTYFWMQNLSFIEWQQAATCRLFKTL